MTPPQFALEKIGGYSVLKGAPCLVILRWAEKKQKKTEFLILRLQDICCAVPGCEKQLCTSQSSRLQLSLLQSSSSTRRRQKWYVSKRNNSLDKVINCMVGGVQVSVLSLLLHHLDDCSSCATVS